MQNTISTSNILHTIGSTPIIPLQRMHVTGQAQVWVKMERHNPMGSIKDRVALAMIEAAEQSGDLRAGYTIVEPSSGSYGGSRQRISINYYDAHFKR